MAGGHVQSSASMNRPIAQLHLQKLLKGVVYRNQYIFGLPAVICGSIRIIQGSPGLPAPLNFEPWNPSNIWRNIFIKSKLNNTDIEGKDKVKEKDNKDYENDDDDDTFNDIDGHDHDNDEHNAPF